MSAQSETQELGNDGLPFPQTFDAMAWAKEFNKRFPSVPVDDAIGWFANAIMRGHDTHAERQLSAPGSWNSADVPLEYITKSADGTQFRNICQLPAHTVEWQVAALRAAQAAPQGDKLERALALINKAIAVLQRQIVPDGISDHEALCELHGIFDGPEYRAMLSAAPSSPAAMSAEKPEAATDAGVFPPGSFKSYPDVIEYLRGSGPLDGAWFGEVPEGEPKYWWRSKLTSLFDEQADAIAALHTDLAYYQAKWEHELSTVSKLERERGALRREVEELKPFKDAIDDQMIILHLGTSDTYPARQCLDEIINWQVSISLDPQVSSDAATLRDTHLERAEASERELAELKAWKADATDILGKGPDILIARSLLKELAACREDAERWNRIHDLVCVHDGVFRLYTLDESKFALDSNLIHGGARLKAAIDSAIKAERGK